MKNTLSLAVIFLSTLLLVSPSMAQESDATGARIEKIERDLMLLQRQISRSSGGSAGTASSPSVGNANLEVRISAIEEQLRDLVGKTEENDFQVKKLAQNLDKLQRDTDFRFNELSHNPASTSPAPSAPDSEQTIKPRAADSENTGKSLGKVVDTAPAAPAASNDTQEPDETEFATPREHYNYAFRLLNQTQYDKAAASFASFIKKYPKDTLIGNAYYWQGEILYIRRNYVGAADSFRQGFEELPTGPKAPDNLLKLAMTLNALKRDKEACVVLGQVVSKFKTASAAVSQKAEQEQKRIGCN